MNPSTPSTGVSLHSAEDQLTGLFGIYAGTGAEQIGPEQTVANFRNAIDQGLLKIMSKMGISVIFSRC